MLLPLYKSPLPEYEPWRYALPFLVRIACYVVYIVASGMSVAVEGVVCAASYVDGVDESVFSQCVGKAPKRLLMAGCDVKEPLAYSAYGATLHLAMKMELRRKFASAHEHKLAEETAAVVSNIVLDIVKT